MVSRRNRAIPFAIPAAVIGFQRKGQGFQPALPQRLLAVSIQFRWGEHARSRAVVGALADCVRAPGGLTVE